MPEAHAGLINKSFINEDITLNITGNDNFVLLNIQKVFIVDPPTVDTAPGSFVTPFTTNPTLNVQTNPLNPNDLTLTWSGNPLSLTKGKNTVHVGAGFNGASHMNPGKVTESPGSTSYSATIKDTTTGKETTTGLPVVSPKITSSGGNGLTHEMFFANVTHGAFTVGEWFEADVKKGGTTSFALTNPGGAPVTISNAGFFTSPTLIPLDDLNATDLPPTDSRFQPIPNIPNGTTIGAGGTVSSIPEPSSLALATVVLTLGLGWMWLRLPRS